MASFFESLEEKHQKFILKQKLFFTASAPAEGRVNLSPKGMDTFRILDANTVAYLDLTGSGNETAAHLLENGRVTVMFCSFDKEPLILRLYCSGKAVHKADPDWAELSQHFELLPGTRQIILMKVESVQTSCGFGIPYYEYQGDRPTLIKYAENKGEAVMEEYREKKNQTSIDGLPTGLFASS